MIEKAIKSGKKDNRTALCEIFKFYATIMAISIYLAVESIAIIVILIQYVYSENLNMVTELEYGAPWNSLLCLLIFNVLAIDFITGSW